MKTGIDEISVFSSITPKPSCSPFLFFLSSWSCSLVNLSKVSSEYFVDGIFTSLVLNTTQKWKNSMIDTNKTYTLAELLNLYSLYNSHNTKFINTTHYSFPPYFNNYSNN